MHVQFTVSTPKSSEKYEKSSEKSSEKIIKFIKNNAQITIKELAEQLNIMIIRNPS